MKSTITETMIIRTLILWSLFCPQACLAFTRTLPTKSAFSSSSASSTRIAGPESKQSKSSSTELYAFWNNPNRIIQKQEREPQTAFLIESIPTHPSDSTFQEIADMCIDVFFKEQLNAQPEDRVAPWKEAQIGYLKTLQTGDLRRRRQKYPKTNEMFLAYEVVPATNGDSLRKPLILDFRDVQNLPSYWRNQDFVRGDVLGFCEITQRQYGLGIVDETENLRAVLTNLAVSNKSRSLGIGSQLLDACEKHAAQQWRLNDIVLEVEDYNEQALEFYDKRGYEVLFSDPASRRFDVGGLMLKKVRCTRNILRKVLTHQRALTGYSDNTSLFQKLKQTVGVF